MKYFMAVYNNARGYERFFQMTSETADFYYHQYLSKHSEVHIQKCIREGQHVSAPQPFSPDLRIWGEEMSDKELFKLRIKGEIETEMLED